MTMNCQDLLGTLLQFPSMGNTAKSMQEEIADHFSSKLSFHIAKREAGYVVKCNTDWDSH